MDSRASAPETATFVSDSSGSPSSYSSSSSSTSSNDSSVIDMNNSTKNDTLLIDGVNGVANVSGGGGYVSGDEVFETAPERIPIQNNNDFVDNKFDDDDEGVVGEVKQEEMEEVGAEAGVVAEEVEVEGRGIDVVHGGEEGEDVGVGGVVERDGVKFTSEGDAVVEDIHVDVLGPGVAVVGDSEEGNDSGVEGVRVVDRDRGSLENRFDKISREVDELVELHDDSEKKSGFLAGFESEAVGLESNGGEIHSLSEHRADTDVVVVVGDDVSIVKNDQEIGEDGEGIDESGKLIVGKDGEKVELKMEEEAVVETKPTNASVEAATEGSDAASHLKVGVNGGEKDIGVENTYSAEPAVSHVEGEDEKDHLEDGGEIEGLDTDRETEGIMFKSIEAAKQFLKELEQGSGVGSPSGAESSHDHSQRIDGQIAPDSDEEVNTDEDGEGKELFDSAALAALLKAATGAGSDGGTITVTSQDGSRLFSVERPAGLGSTLRSLKPAARPNRPNLFTSSNLNSGGESDNLSKEQREKLEKLQQLRVRFLRLVYRLGHSAEESTTSQVLYRLALVAGRQTNQLFNLNAAKRTALELEDEGKDDLDFSLNILVLGKTGVGKSATINSIFGEQKSQIHAFESATSSVKEMSGMVDGVKIRVIDSPGLKSSGSEQGFNHKVLSSIKRLMKKFPPDIVLYVDRLDTQTRDLNDLPLLRTITSTLGSSIWRSVIVTLTHAASAPPDGPSGSPLSYEVFVAQCSHVVQQSIGQAVGDLRLMNPSLMNPVSLVENHPSCRKNRDGQKVLPNGQAWRSQLLLLCFSMKILSEANSLSKPQDPFDHRKLFGFRARSAPLPYLLSWLLQSRTHPKLSSDQGADSVDSDVDLADLSDSDVEEEEDEYDQLPPFKPLRKNQLAKLSREQRKAYFEEYDYQVKLLQKKQWREELRRMKEIKKKGKVAADDYGYMGEDADLDGGGPASVPVPLSDMVLPPSFDSDNPGYRYRFLEPTSQILARPVLDTHGWDHDCGYDGVNVEQSLAVINRFPAAIAVQVTKDKKEFNIHLDSSVSAKHGENGSSMAGFDIQNVGKQLAYVVRGETKFKNLKKNKTAAGVSVTFLGKNVATGFKLEDQFTLGKRLTLVGSTGTVRSQGDSVYGANLEVRLREADFPTGQDQSSLGLSLVKWRGDLALGANLQSQFSIGRSSKIAVRAGLNNKMSGQLTVRTSSSEQLQLALVALFPIAMSIYKAIRPGGGENSTMY